MAEIPNTRQLFAVLTVTFLLVIAGCTGGGGQLNPAGPDETEPQTGGLLSDPPTQNPWRADNITVKVVEQPDDRDYEPMIIDSIEYWNENMSAVGWEGEFVYDSTTDNPDVPVRVVEEIDKCGTEDEHDTEDTLGCAPVYNQTGQAIDQPNGPVVILSGLNNSSTVDVSIHEFGHTLGLTHENSESWSLMNATITTASVPQLNITERANPFEKEILEVYYNDSENRLNDDISSEFDDVWAYYNSGDSEIVPSTITFQQTSNESEADIKIDLVDDLESGVSTAGWYGYDPDADGALETYSTATIKIQADVGENYVAWHVGSWTTYLFSSQEEGALPDELTTRDADTRRDWPS